MAGFNGNDQKRLESLERKLRWNKDELARNTAHREDRIQGLEAEIAELEAKREAQ